MGRTPQPLSLKVTRELYEAHQTRFDALGAQGHQIDVMEDGQTDAFLSPRAFRLTGDMLEQMPTQALDIVLKGVRALRYGPQGKDKTAWKGAKKRSAKTKKTNKGQDAAEQAQAAPGGELQAEGPSVPATTGLGPQG